MFTPRLVRWMSPSIRQLYRNLTSPAGIVTCDMESITLPNMCLTPLLMEKARIREDKIALEDAETRECLRFGELADKVENLAKALGNRGYGKGTVVAVLLPNCIQYPVIFLGAAAAQCVVSPMNPAYTMEELRGLLIESGARCTVTDTPNLAKVSQACEGLGVEVMVIGEGETGVLGMEALCREGKGVTYQLEEGDPDSVVLLPFSSGTTGRPKGVQLSHNNVVANILQCVHLDICEETSSAIIIMPMYHAGGLKGTLEYLYHGGTAATMPSFNPTIYLDSLLRYKPTQQFVAPPLLQFLVKSKDCTVSHLASTQTVISGAAPVGETLIKELLKKAPQALFREAWGMTEMSALGTITPPSWSLDPVASYCPALNLRFWIWKQALRWGLVLEEKYVSRVLRSCLDI